MARAAEKQSLAQMAKAKGIKYFLISYSDLGGVSRSKLVPAAAIDTIATDGAGFAGFSTYLDMTPAHQDMFGMADMDAMIQLPWKKEVAWVPSNLMMSGKEVGQGPRNVLRRMIARAAK